MSKRRELPFEVTAAVRDACLCLHAQRAARALARRFDNALSPLDLTNGQFSLLMSLNRPSPPHLGSLAELLAMDRTTVTAALKALVRRGLVQIKVDEEDRRGRLLVITSAGRRLLEKAFPVWKKTHSEVEKAIAGLSADKLRQALRAMA
ncbi:MAG TPA: MarR family transcriptional regulator [Pseudolabrys sp.]|nr:MarR family transcriptional regulator [Pseudolabrys sp.]